MKHILKKQMILVLVFALFVSMMSSALAAVGTGWNDDYRMRPAGDDYGRHDWVKQSKTPGSDHLGRCL